MIKISKDNSISFMASNVDEAIFFTMKALSEKGNRVEPPSISNSTKPTIELENFLFTINSPRDRISINPHNPLNVVSSVGRFTWIMAGNDRLEDMAFYQSKVREYTDDGLTIPGSDYGKRIFDPTPDTDQLKNVIDLLKKDPYSRRAIIPIWSYQDSKRLESKDIPCAFGLSFLIRENELHSTLMMRSNYALRLLPVNIFEFTLIGEIVAKELGINYGRHAHYSVSMHIFENDLQSVKQWLKVPQEEIFNQNRLVMPEIPQNNPLMQAKELAKLEASLRNENVLINASNVNEHLNKAKNTLDEYWFEFFKVLCIGALIHAKEMKMAKDLSQNLQPYFRQPITSYLSQLPELTTKMPSYGTLDVFISDSQHKFREIQKALAPETEEISNIVDVLHLHVDEFEKSKKIMLTRKEYAKLEKRFLHRTVLAARSTGEDKNAEDLRKISKDEVWEAIHEILSDK